MVPNLYQAKSAIDSFGGKGPQMKVAQNVLKHILVSEFLKSYETLKFEKIGNCPQPDRETL